MEYFKSIALIPAAGTGKRMGAAVNKQYLDLDGIPIVARTIAVFESSPLIDAIYLVTPSDEIPYCQEHIVARYGFKKIVAIVPGGAERQQSVLNGLNAMVQGVSAGDIILIHDGVRPFIPHRLLEESIAMARIHDGVLVAVPVKDTIKRVHNGIVLDTPPRESLWQAQTPQSFRFEKILSAHHSAAAKGIIGTDDASLVERSGGNVHIIQGDYGNIKITTPDDLILAGALLQNQDKKDL